MLFLKKDPSLTSIYELKTRAPTDFELTEVTSLLVVPLFGRIALGLNKARTWTVKAHQDRASVVRKIETELSALRGTRLEKFFRDAKMRREALRDLPNPTPI